jgi:hypothetical protein
MFVSAQVCVLVSIASSGKLAGTTATSARRFDDIHSLKRYLRISAPQIVAMITQGHLRRERKMTSIDQQIGCSGSTSARCSGMIILAVEASAALTVESPVQYESPS